MVYGFRRSHVRTSSLHCSVHPLVSHLEAEIHATLCWLSCSDRDPAPATTLRHMDTLISTVEQVLSLPESREFLCYAESTDHLLDELLCLADVYGSIRSVAITLKQNHAELHSALRRHDARWLAASVKSQRHTEKELSHLAATVHHLTSSSASSTEIGIVMREAVTVAAAASVDVISKVMSITSAAASSAMVAVGSSRISLVEGLFKERCSKKVKEAAAMENLKAMDKCVTNLESGSEKVFMSLVKARVSLLNVVTLSF